MIKRIEKIFSLRAFLLSAISAVLVLTIFGSYTKASAYGMGQGASLFIECGGGYKTVYEAYNDLSIAYNGIPWADSEI